MTLKDMNQSWKQPEGYRFAGVMSQGAFLMAVFIQDRDTPLCRAYHQIVVYVNDMGREVMRTEELSETYLPLKPPVHAPAPVGRWFRIKNGFLIALHGLQEMFK
jgi:hypothetical protein